MWIAVMIFLTGAAIAGEIALRQSPKAHAIVSAVVWTTEGLFLALAVAGLAYRYFTGNFP
jgi:hypothetical protein